MDDPKQNTNSPGQTPQPELLRVDSPSKKIYILAAIVLTVIIASTLLLFFLFNSDKKDTQQSQAAPTPEKEELQTALPPPTIDFREYTEPENSSVTAPTTIGIHTLKSNYTTEEITEIANKFGLTQTKTTDTDYILAYNNTDPENRGIMSFNTNSGELSYTSYGNLKTPTQSENIQSDALTFLRQLGIADETITCPVTYKKQSLDPITYVECHRDWEKVSLPILNLAGILNTPLDNPLSDLKLAQISDTSPQDSSIVSVSTDPQANGKARPNDFNTATIAMTSDGRILSVNSNLRPIELSQRVEPDDLLTPEQALQQFKQKKAQTSLTLPIGSGYVDWQKVYQDNKATADIAIVKDFSLTYLEANPSVAQSALIPMYVIRGEAMLDNGYSVSFAQSVPAVKNESLPFSFIPKAQAQENSLQLKTFTPPPEQPTSTPRPTQTSENSPTPTTTVEEIPTQTLSQCENPVNGDEIEINVVGLGKLTVINNADFNRAGQSLKTNSPHTFFFKSADFPTSDMNDIKNAFFKTIEEQYTTNVVRKLKDSQVTISSPSEAKDYFKKLNGGNSCPTAELYSIGFKPAPFFSCSSAISATYDTSRMESIATNVANNVLEVVQSNKVSSYPQEDYFPSTVLRDFHWIFIKNTISTAPLSAEEKACYITGESPTIFLYPQETTQINISLPTSTSYTYPPSDLSGWNVTAKPNGQILESTNRLLSSLYYEYNPTNTRFTNSSEYFIVKYDKTDTLIQHISSQLGLTNTEEKALSREIYNSLYKTPRLKYLKISFADQDEVNTQLPFIITPDPDNLHRIHLLITTLDKSEKASPPSLQKLERTGFTAIEIGARTVK